MFSNENNNEFSAVKQQELEAVNGGLSLDGGFDSGFSSGDFGGAVSLPGIGGGGDLVTGGLLVVQPGLGWGDLVDGIPLRDKCPGRAKKPCNKKR